MEQRYIIKNLQELEFNSDNTMVSDSFQEMAIKHRHFQELEFNPDNTRVLDLFQEMSIGQINSSQSTFFDQFSHQLITPEVLTMAGILALSGLLLLIPDSKKGKLGTSYWGGSPELAAARRKALKQIRHPQRNSAALYVGMPQEVREQLEREWLLQGRLERTREEKSTNTYYFPDVQRGISVIGGAGSGKTFSLIDPLIRSTLDQGFPIALYDFKYPAQTSRAVAYALKRGYKVRVFAPGYPESDVCNLLDFLRDEEDAVAAGQLAQVIAKNTDMSGGKASGDKFFEDAGETLVEGIFLLSKAVAKLAEKPDFCDLMLASAILSLPKLGNRLEFARRSGKFPIWTMRPLDQLISVASSEETESGIIGTAQRTFQKFLKKDFIGAFCGQSTLPLDLDGKEMLVFGLDRNNRDIVSPLLAAVLHMVVSRNVSRTIPRNDPLMVFLDEIPTLYLPQLQNWFNENREDGFCGVIGFQNRAQLEYRYGKELAQVIMGGTATKCILNPQETDSNKYFADLLGEFEVSYRTKSRSSGAKGSHSRSTSENRQKRYLLEPAQFAKLPTGRAVIISPGYRRGKEAYIPLLKSISVPEADIAEQEWAKARWQPIRDYLIEVRGQGITDDERSRQFEARRQLAEQMFPLPDGEGQVPMTTTFNNDLVQEGLSFL